MLCPVLISDPSIAYGFGGVNQYMSLFIVLSCRGIWLCFILAYMRDITHRERGFTIVELIVVIVVIAILAAIVVVSYSWMKGDALKTRRLSDATQLQKALEVYKTKNGEYPATGDLRCRAVSGHADSWESSQACPSEFLSSLKPYLGSKTIVDPENSRDAHYEYFRYPAGSKGCDASRGDFYVLRIYNTKAQRFDESPGWRCDRLDWSTDPKTAYVVGGFTK